MNKSSIYFIIILCTNLLSAGKLYPQVSKTKVEEKTKISYPIAGSDLLGEEYLQVAQFLKNNPNFISHSKLSKPSAWNFTVGTQKTWTALNYSTNSEYSVASTCKAVGVHCYVFVADDVWGTSVDSNAVTAIVNSFDNQTPINPNKGIYQTDVDTFGDPPDVDNDPRIIILILDIKDGYSGTGGFVAGYFSPNNEIRSGGDAAEIYFMDANPLNLKTASGLNDALETAAHEFQHMINWNYHQSNPELTFINEGLSMAAEIINGYAASMQNLYANEPNHYLFDWRTSDMTLVLNDYARAQRFFLYLMEQLGLGSLKEIVHDYTTYGLTGVSGLSKILSQNYSLSLGQLIINWEIANGLNNTNVNSKYGYDINGIPVSSGTVFYNPNADSTAASINRLGAEYLIFENSTNLNITFSSNSSNVIVKAIEIGAGSSRVVDVPLNTSFTEVNYPSVYNKIRFAVIDSNQYSDEVFDFSSSGTGNSAITLRWDFTEPTGYYLWTPNDTVCVTFDAVPGGKLDSIMVALRRAGSITGGVWQYTGSTAVSPLGKKLAFPITASINTTVNFPYPVPYNNWSTVDLSSYNIPTDKPFAVGFVIGSDPKTPGIMTTNYPSSSSYHSYTYLQTSDQVTTPGWYFITTNSSGDTIAIYLIRAYVSLVTGVDKHILELEPKVYNLAQNYPNPFNPTTTINYTITKTGLVTIKVYDVLGKQVATLVNEEKPAGQYSVQLSANISQLSSGVYFYRMQAGNFAETKKFILLK